MKNILVTFILWIGCMSAVQAQQHPCVYVSPADRASVLQKVKNEPWAGEAFCSYPLQSGKICGSSSD